MTMPLNPVEREFSPELDKLAAELASISRRNKI